jgi:hypothetical protein
VDAYTLLLASFLLLAGPLPTESAHADYERPTAGVRARVACVQITRFWMIGQLPRSGRSVVAWRVR